MAANGLAMRRRAEWKRQAIIAQQCSEAIDALLGDSGPLSALPSDIRAAISGDIASAVRTLTAEMERAEAASQ